MYLCVKEKKVFKSFGSCINFKVVRRNAIKIIPLYINDCSVNLNYFIIEDEYLKI